MWENRKGAALPTTGRQESAKGRKGSNTAKWELAVTEGKSGEEIATAAKDKRGKGKLS